MPFNQRPNGRGRVSFTCVGESETKQANASETDINVIMAKYVRTGDVSVFNERVGQYADVSSVGDYASCQEMILNARESFAILPAKVRDAFENDPGKLAVAMTLESERGRLEELGILIPAIKEPPVAKAGTDTAKVV